MQQQGSVGATEQHQQQQQPAPGLGQGTLSVSQVLAQQALSFSAGDSSVRERHPGEQSPVSFQLQESNHTYSTAATLRPASKLLGEPLEMRVHTAATQRINGHLWEVLHLFFCQWASHDCKMQSDVLSVGGISFTVNVFPEAVLRHQLTSNMLLRSFC